MWVFTDDVTNNKMIREEFYFDQVNANKLIFIYLFIYFSKIKMSIFSKIVNYCGANYLTIGLIIDV